MKRMLAALAACALMLPVGALAQIRVTGEQIDGEGENCVYLFSVEQTEQTEEADPALLRAGQLIEARFAQQKSAQLLERANALGGDEPLIRQGIPADFYEDERIVSVARTWMGEQANGRDGHSAAGLTLDRQTGEEIAFDQLFADPDAAAAAMEAVIERDVLENMSGYMEYAELLPMPRDNFALSDAGLTVFYPDDRYRYYDGRSGSVTFYWHEIAPFIGEDSPIYAASRPQAADAQAIRRADGYFGENRLLGLGEPLEKALVAYPLSEDPDYTRVSKLYAVERADRRGYAVEIPRYADTEDARTPISAVRHSRVSWHGLTTGRTTREEITALLGEPERTIFYDEDAAADMLLTPGESLVYACDNFVLEAHLDEGGVLDCLILRSAMPEDLY